MKKIILFVAAVMMAGFSTTAMAQTSATVTGTAAGASLIIPLKIAQNATLNFGSITLLDATGGTVLLPSDNITCTYNGGVAYSAVGAKPLNAAYTVTGTMNSTYAVTLPGTITVKETTKSVATMTIGSLKAHFAGAGVGN